MPGEDEQHRRRLSAATRWVVKVGTSLLTDPEAGLNKAAIDSLVAQMAELRGDGAQILLVSSGSVVEGMQRMGWKSRPSELDQLQAAAAVGQMGLAQCYESAFRGFGIVTAQVLLTHADLADRERYLNARNTLRTLLSLGVVPIINENDAVVNDEIRFGDNDTLAALVANLVEAEVAVLLTDREGLYNNDPDAPSAQLIRQARAGDPELLRHPRAPGAFGRGGMLTKILAAQKAARSGAATVIADGRDPRILPRLRAGECAGTLLTPGTGRLAARKQWLAGQLRGNGEVVLDDGAVRVLRESGKSLLPIGVVGVRGAFRRGDIITCVTRGGGEVARGLVNYSSEEAARIAGKPSGEIEAILGYAGDSELIHRDNIALTG
ncbi:MAG: glutamate 5-kinase [Gammaproteobacteria bacterium]|nr:glutamate 5-kinase [Gammaproteobacteria bacterium]MDA7991168.1 glutamate 5-kinase [Gammaproteobacteria bacterium]MDA8008073.1 glutamate 5-kinase [Gammaproteobacteria bacterium]MDA8012077.1 glutamate 5-kinase [Gammaproteobacteria bacterium]